MSPSPTPDPNAQTSATPTASASTAMGHMGSNCLLDIQVLKNDGSNFTTWKFQITCVLLSHRLWKIVSGQAKMLDKSADPTGHVDWITQDAEADNGVAHW